MSAPAAPATSPDRPVAIPPAGRPGHVAEGLLRRVSGAAAVLPLAALVFIVATLAWKAWPAIRFNGLGFLTRVAWKPGDFYSDIVATNGATHPPGASYGALPLVTGTLESAAIALVLAVPVSIGAALAITEKLPARLSQAIGFFIEVLAGIPSVIFGLWGIFTLGPLLSRVIFPLIARHVPDVPVLNFFRGATGSGEGLLTAGVVLAIMIVPIVAATTRDLLRQVPILPKEGAQALGMSEWEVARRVTLPWVRAGIIGACVLGLARALGETIAVAMVSGAALGANAHNAYSTFTTIAATIVSQLDSALSDASGFAVRTLAEAALVLVVITLLTNVAGRLLVRRVATAALPVGRGI